MALTVEKFDENMNLQNFEAKIFRSSKKEKMLD